MRTFHFFIPFIIVFSAACSPDKTKDNQQGKELAQTYCSSCHSFPEPDLLDKNSWEQYILPRMGVFLGIIEHDSLRNILVADETERQLADKLGVFPEKPVLSNEEWQKIKASEGKLWTDDYSDLLSAIYQLSPLAVKIKKTEQEKK